MSRLPILTLEQAQRVSELRRQGLTLEVLAVRFGVSLTTLRACLARLAAVEASGPHQQSDSAPFSEAGGAAAARQ
jgi:hypothetical protein